MKFTSTDYGTRPEILANDDWAGMPFTATADMKAGDIVTGKGVCLYDIKKDDNPNGTYIYRGVIDVRKIADSQKPTKAQVSAFPQIIWLNADNSHFEGTSSGT